MKKALKGLSYSIPIYGLIKSWFDDDILTETWQLILLYNIVVIGSVVFFISIKNYY
jgi:hypothetical protein